MKLAPLIVVHDTVYMNNTNDLTNQFLIAMPALLDPNFYHSVTYICEHNSHGTMGIIINHPLDMALSDILTQMDIASANDGINQMPIYHGGPVQVERGFVLHRPSGSWDAEIKVSDDISITTSRDILAALAQGEGPDDALIALGYAAWEPGQLEQELAENSWLTCHANPAIIFDTPNQDRWSDAATSIGFKLEQLTHQIGHA